MQQKIEWVFRCVALNMVGGGNMFSRIARGLYIELRASLASLVQSRASFKPRGCKQVRARYPYPARSIAPSD